MSFYLKCQNSWNFSFSFSFSFSISFSYREENYLSLDVYSSRRSFMFQYWKYNSLHNYSLEKIQILKTSWFGTSNIVNVWFDEKFCMKIFLFHKIWFMKVIMSCSKEMFGIYALEYMLWMIRNLLIQEKIRKHPLLWMSNCE